MEYDYKHPETRCPNITCDKKDDCCGITKVVIAAVLGEDSAGSKVAPFNGAYCNKIVEYEANGAIYFYSSDGIYTKLGNKSKSEETASVEYVDQQTRYAINQAKGYTDSEIDEASSAITIYVNGADAAVLAEAKEYADDKADDAETNSKNYAEAQDVLRLADAESYADAVAAQALQDAKDYTDSAASGVVTKNYVDTGDQNTLDAANQYTDGQIALTETALEDLEDSLATVATSGSYDDLIDSPIIPIFTLTDQDPGEGAPLEEYHFIGVYS